MSQEARGVVESVALATSGEPIAWLVDERGQRYFVPSRGVVRHALCEGDAVIFEPRATPAGKTHATAWVLANLGRSPEWEARVLARDDTLDLAHVDAWLTSGEADIPASSDHRPRSQHLAQHPASRRVLRFLRLLTGRTPEIEQARPGVAQMFGWLSANALSSAPLPGGHSWSEVIGADTRGARWSLIVDKTTSHTAMPTAARRSAGLLDFGLFLHDGPLTPVESERISTSVRRRGLRAVVLPVTQLEDSAAAREQLVNATVDALRTNVDVFLSRSVSGEAFFGRTGELAAISAALARGSGAALTGVRKAGKSSLAAQYAARVLDDTSGILDFNMVPTPYDEAALASEVGRHVGVADARSFDALARRLSAEAPRTLILDELGIPMEQARMSAAAAAPVLALLMFLRRALDEGLLHVIACNPLRSLYLQPYVTTAVGRVDNPLLQRFDVIPVRGLELAEAAALVRFYARRSLVDVAPEVSRLLAAQCAGFPLVVRAALHHATNGRPRPAVLDATMVREALLPSSDPSAPWEVVRSTMWRWAGQWAGPQLRAASRGEPMVEDDVADDLRAAGLVDGGGALAFPLLARVAERHAADLATTSG